MLAYLQLTRCSQVVLGQLGGPLGITRQQEQELLRRMARKRLIARVRGGVYLVPMRLPLGGKWTPSEALALNTLIGGKGGRYQVCGLAAFNRLGLDEQVPQEIQVLNNRYSGSRRVGGLRFRLIKVATRRLGGTESVRFADGQRMPFASRPRALFDALYDGKRFNTQLRACTWIRDELDARRVAAADLVSMCERYGDGKTARRMGALLGALGTGEVLLRRLGRVAGSVRILVPLVPQLPPKGRVDRRWGVVINAAF